MLIRLAEIRYIPKDTDRMAIEMSALQERERTISSTLDEVRELDAVRDALSDGRTSVAAERLDRLRTQRLQHAPVVPISIAAKLLDVSEPTVRAWANRAVLEDVPSRPRGVSLESVVRVSTALQELRTQAKSADLRRALLARIEDAITVEDPRVALSMSQMKAGKIKHYVHQKGS